MCRVFPLIASTLSKKKEGEWLAEFSVIIHIRKGRPLVYTWNIHSYENLFLVCDVSGIWVEWFLSVDLNMWWSDFKSFLLLYDLRVGPGYFSHGRNQCNLWAASAGSHLPTTNCSPEKSNGRSKAPLQNSSASQGSVGATDTPWKFDLPLWWATREQNMAESCVSTCLLILTARTAQETLWATPRHRGCKLPNFEYNQISCPFH